MPSQGTTTIVLADDHQIVVEALQRLIETHTEFRVVGTANDAQGAIEACRLHRPDIAVLDVSMPGGGGFEVARRLREMELPTRAVMLTMYAEDRHVLEAVRLGVTGYVVKRAAGKELLEAVRAVARGDAYLPPSAVKLLVARQSDLEEDGRPGLSAREREVLRYTARGFSNQEIGARLFISPKTVDTYRSRVMTKLDIHRRSELVDYALRNGLLDEGAVPADSS